jgi:glycosyltransferase involved in cell wall biosynthesis
MHVLHVIPSVAPRYGGPSYAVVRYCRALGARGVRVTMATTNADGRGVLPVPLDEATDYEGIDARFFERRGEAFKYSPALARWLRRSVENFDVVHIHAVFSHASLTAGRACRLAGVPYIVRPLGSLDPWSLSQHAWRKRVLLWSAAGSLLRQAAGLHFTTDGERDLAARAIGPLTSRVIALGVDDEYLAPPIVPAAERERLITVLARLDRKKNLDTLIRAFHSAAPGNSPWRLTIAGAGDESYAAELRRLASAGAAAQRIEFRGWIDGKEKLDLLRRSSVFAVPSHQENFGLGALEAMACGVPVLAGRGVNLTEAIERADAGWVSGIEEADLVASLAELMQDEVGRHRRAINARKLAANYTWGAAAMRLEVWYSELAPRLAAKERR